MGPPVQLKLDPWASDYDGAVAIAAEDMASPVPVDVTVERARWQAIDPPEGDGRPVPLVLIDGVRRVEARVLAGSALGGTDGGPAFGLLGSFAVGAVCAGNGPPEILAVDVRRLLVLGRGLEHPDLTVRLPGANGGLGYAWMAVPGAEPEAPLQGLQTAMRRAEADLAQNLAGAGAGAGGGTGAAPPAGALVVADGPLAYLERTRVPLLGFVKSLHRAYLGPAEFELLPGLRPGQRTPIFTILDQHHRYSWYLRLGTGGPAEHDLAGIARLECSSSAGLEAAQAAADRAAPALVRAASTRERDPRSPQNLIPLGGLEAALRHRLGDRALLRRAITATLAGGAR
jgi:hypothetical protein